MPGEGPPPSIQVPYQIVNPVIGAINLIGEALTGRRIPVQESVTISSQDLAVLFFGVISRGKAGKADAPGRFNPFIGKTPVEIERMFLQKGFEPKGPNPLQGLGGYVNPKTGRSYHIDTSNRFGEESHIDVNRLRGYQGELEKRKFPF